MRIGVTILISLALSQSAHADCGSIAKEFQESTPRLETAADVYKKITAAVSEASDRAKLYPQILSANGNVLNELNTRAGLLERGEVEGCFGTQADVWRKVLAELQGQRDRFKKERDTLVSSAPVIQGDHNNKTTNGKTTAELIDERLDKQFQSFNQGSPIELDSVTVLTHAERFGKLIVYNYKLKIKKSDWTAAIQNQQTQNLTKGNCSNNEIRAVLAVGYEYRYDYVSSDGLLLSNILITERKCEAYQSQKIQ